MGKGNRSAAATAAAAAAAFFLIMVSCIGSSSGQALAPGPYMAFGPSPSPEDDCLMKVLNMSDCLSYVTEGSNVTVPDKPCCPELAGLVESNPICLCQLLGKNNTYGIKIDITRALKLPSVCGVTTPPVNLCSLAGVPIEAPTGSPGPASPGTQPPSGLAASPSNGNNDNAASGNAGSVLALLVGLAVASLI
ncbi:AAI domain-containing protein [Citrus sinensis]|uniref:Bifunctional inhibitor/plant lipid transfer protein/seed storage helical domain-containing protein n=1 Tax=Citrus clementina TaxID=85681 RepID=V4TH15_CITCL|nr:non-specific lipid transfer protein GPI-anchored 2 [Citrus x clementina]XP_006470415.2 non-specific lipid transfer protein GPI-anchored 2-like [Citrus sinensis]ESR59653.1 hypothetical protein CICLE_v10016831mg [Citrus x clementina]KAH9741954.1 AAI domain-containing protein [Citrus sinensis]GAY50822.1 hypothetical protein CUMW_129680 [Citrus unshiu]